MADEVILEAELFDSRDPQRPAVFIAPKGAKVPRELADKFGGVYAKPASVKARKEADVEDKAVKPATKSLRKKD